MRSRRTCESDIRADAGSANRNLQNRMFSTLSFIGKWKQWYRVLRYRKGFGLFGLRALWPVAGARLTGRCCRE